MAQDDEVLIIVVMDNKVTALRTNKAVLSNVLSAFKTEIPKTESLSLFTSDAIKADAKFN